MIYKQTPEAIANREWQNRPGNRLKHLQRTKERAREIKAQVLSEYSNGELRCACPGCNITNLTFLTLDHVNNDGREHRKLVTGFGDKFYRFLRKNGFPKNPQLQVLCYNCNCGKRANGGSCPMYSRTH